MGGSVNLLDPLGIAQGSQILDPLGIVQNPKVPTPPRVSGATSLPTEVDDEVLNARKRARRQAAQRRGRSSTILTRPQGLPSLLTEIFGEK